MGTREDVTSLHECSTVSKTSTATTLTWVALHHCKRLYTIWYTQEQADAYRAHLPSLEGAREDALALH